MKKLCKVIIEKLQGNDENFAMLIICKRKALKYELVEITLLK